MTIIYLYHSFYQYGGTERVLTEKMNYLADVYGYNIILVSYSQFNKSYAFQLSPKIKCYDLKIPLFHIYNYGLFKRFIYYRKMRSTIIEKVKNIINNNHANILICTTYDFIFMDITNQFRRHIQTIIETHINEKYLYTNYKKGIVKGIAISIQRILTNKFIKHASAFVTLTEGDKKAWEKTRKDIIVIPNSIGTFPIILQQHRTYKRIISVGRLDRQKGYDLLIKAWTLVIKKHSDWHLDIFGEGDEKGQLLVDISLYNLTSSIKINCPSNYISLQFQSSDFYVMSSRFEGFGMVLIESMACGIPCVSFDCPYGPSDIITDGYDGLLVENGNIDALAEKICYMIENEEQRKVMGVKAVETVKRFLPENIMPKWEQLFENLLYLKVLSK